MTERKETWRKGIKITDMKTGDLIYIQKSIGSFSVMLECEFIKYEKGIVYAKVSAIPYPRWFSHDYPIGKLITARKKKCMLWGRDIPEGYAYCHWFKDKVKK